MEPLAVDLLLLRALDQPELRLAPGRALMARVVEADGSGRGSLSIAGALVKAGLPKDVSAGDEVRLVVREVSAERVVLNLAQQSPVVPVPAEVPLPGGGSVRASPRDEADGQGSSASQQGTHSVSLRYDAPTLGPIDLRFQLDPASLLVTASVAAGAPLDAIKADADALRGALAASVDRTVTVTVVARHEPLDVYA
jgi:hypothetical protein